jgi:mono/diheme cytochrome c family protein
MKISSLFPVILVAVLAGVIGCSSARREEPIKGALKVEDKQVAAGQRAFMAHCHQCHPGGRAGLGPAINNKPLPGFMIKLQSRIGLGAMPGFSSAELSDEDLDMIVVYLKALRKHE